MKGMANIEDIKENYCKKRETITNLRALVTNEKFPVLVIRRESSVYRLMMCDVIIWS